MNNATGVDLADIVSPAMPAAGHWSALGISAALIGVLLGAVVAWALLRSRGAAARRRLRRLERALRRGEIEPRAAAYAVAAALQRAFSLTQLTTRTPIPQQCRRRRAASHDWHLLLTTLNSQRYGSAQPAPATVHATLREAKRWLRPWC